MDYFTNPTIYKRKIYNNKIYNDFENTSISLYKIKERIYSPKFYFGMNFDFLTKIKIIFNYKNTITKKDIYDLLLRLEINISWESYCCDSLQNIHILIFLSLLKICGKNIKIKIKKNKIIIPISSGYEVNNKFDEDDNFSLGIINMPKLCDCYTKYIMGQFNALDVVKIIRIFVSMYIN